jgi:hypothetical protein
MNNQNKCNEVMKTLQIEKKKNAFLHPINHAVYSHQQRELGRLEEERETLYCKLDRI